MCGRGSQRGILTGTVPCALHSALRGDTALLWVRRLEPPGTYPNPNPTPNRDPPPKPKPSPNPNPAIEPPSGMGPHFTPRERSLDWSRYSPGNVPGPILTLAKALSPWGPNSNA